MSLAPPFLRRSNAAMASDLAQLAAAVCRSSQLLQHMEVQATISAHTHRAVAKMMESYAQKWDGFAMEVSQHLSGIDDILSGATLQSTSALPLTATPVTKEAHQVTAAEIEASSVMRHLCHSNFPLGYDAVSLLHR